MYAVTHDATFHADDVFAGAVLTIACPDVEIARTRDAAQIAAADVAFDVGGGRYDHHQPEGGGVRPNGVPYAAFGLIWRDYGPRAVERVLPTPPSAAECAAIVAEVDRALAQPIDAADNGVSLHKVAMVPGWGGDSDGPITQDFLEDVRVVPAFDGVWPATLTTMVGWLRPTEAQHNAGVGDNLCYRFAVTVAQIILANAIAHAAATVAAQAEIERAITHRYGAPVVLFNALMPAKCWYQAVRERTDALYAVYPVSGGGWRCEGVPAFAGDIALRKPLPAAWAGLNSAALAELTGVGDATFAHRGRFIAGAASREGALALAYLAVKA